MSCYDVKMVGERDMKKTVFAMFMAGLMLVTIFSVCLTVSAANSGSGDSEQCYGFIIPVSDDQSVNIQNSICKLVNELLGKNVDVYWIASDLSVSSKGLDENDVAGVIAFGKGSFVIPFSGNPSTDLEITVTVYRYDRVSSVAIYKVMGSLSDITVYELVEPKIAYHAGEGVSPWSYLNCLKNGGFPDGELLDWDEITLTKLNEFNVFIWGGTYGDYNFNEFNKWNSAVDSVKNFIKNGGGYVGSCLGGFVASKGIGIPLPDLDLDLPIPDYFIGIDCITLLALPGDGTVNIEIADPDNPVAFGVKEFTEQKLYGGPVFTLLGANTKPLAVYDSVAEGSFDWWDGDIPEAIRTRWASYTLGRPSAVTSQLGDGKVVAFGTHPEWGIGDDSSFRMVHNSIFYVTSQGPISINLQKSVSFQNMDLDAGGPYEGSMSESISFQGSVSSEYQPSCWFWDFDDGETSTNQNPTHAYSSPQEYTVLLFAADNNNIDVDVTTADIQGDLNVWIPGGYYDTTIQDSPYYYAEVYGGFSPYSYHWNMGDGTTLNKESFSYSHENVGIYDASVTVTDKFGTSDTCYFKIIVNDMNSYFEISYLVVDPYCTAIGVDIAFSAFIEVIDKSHPPGTYHCKLDFDDDSSDEKSLELEGGHGRRLEWLHNYSNLGKFYPILTVTDDYGNMYFAITGVNINNLGPPVKPAKPSGPTSVKTGYDNGGEYSVTTTDPDGDQIEYEWDTDNDCWDTSYWFESGETCTTHLYWDEEGEYNLRVRAMDDHGHTSEWSDPLTVNVAENDNIKDDNEHGPLAKLTASSDIITRGNTKITFDASGSTPGGIAPITWIRWDFDDDEEWDTIWRLFIFNKKKTKNFNYLFNEDNTGITEFDVKVEIKDILQRTNTATKKITVDYSDDEQQMTIKFKKGIWNVPPKEVYKGETFKVIVKRPLGILPIAGAEVTFDGTTKTTNIRGRVTFTANNAGTYIITAEKEGYTDTSRSITIYSDDDDNNNNDNSDSLEETIVEEQLETTDEQTNTNENENTLVETIITTPTEPINPEVLNEPVTPTPVTPVPVTPVNLVDPVDPIDPVYPTPKPVNPEEPELTEPTETIQPEVPNKPVTPEELEPIAPTKPENTDTTKSNILLVTPEETDPVEPVVVPEKPEIPVSPTEPASSTSSDISSTRSISILPGLSR